MAGCAAGPSMRPTEQLLQAADCWGWGTISLHTNLYCSFSSFQKGEKEEEEVWRVRVC